MADIVKVSEVNALSKDMQRAEERRIRNLRMAIWERRVLHRMTDDQIALDLKVSLEEIEDQVPLIEAAVRHQTHLTRQTIRDAQTKDLLDAIKVCREIIQSRRRDISASAKQQAMDRMIKLYDRLAKNEGTDKHKDKLEVSGPGGSALGIDSQDKAVLLDIFRRRQEQEKQARSGDVIDVPFEALG